MRPSSALRLLRTFACFAAAAVAAPTLLAQSSPAAAELVHPSVRVVAPISDAQLTTLPGNVHRLAQARYDQGAVAPTMPTGRMMLLLQRSPEQQTALHRYLDELKNPASPSYRKWLTPETLGKTYGVSDADVATIEGWLQSQGFRIESVPPARNMILFSGTASSVASAFHTSIHSYLVNGEKHIANANDPQIPTALAPVIAGIAPMNDFRPKPEHTMGPRGVYDAATKRIKPQLTLTDNQGNDYLYVDPADAATIYNTPNSTLNGNYSAAHSWDGSGVTIGIVGYSDLTVNDVLNYRTAFLNDADSAHLPQVIYDGVNPGLSPGGAAVEALLDTEVSGGIAPGASINYYTAESTDLQDGLALAILRALDDNAVDILSASFGNCEAALQSESANIQYSDFWEQAASQGISVTVSTGDSGSAACDNPDTETVAQYGLAVNGLGSTPYNIAVGGTDFAVLISNFSTYVSNQNAGPYYRTALGFIPEVPWNDSIGTNGTIASNVAYSGGGSTDIVAGGGGSSSIYAKPAFQTSLTPNDGSRDLPDVSLLAGNGFDGATWVVCADSLSAGDTSTYTDCSASGGNLSGATFTGVGGTSAAAPAFAGMLALVSQSQGNVRLGQANDVLYNLAANHYSTVFHDTVTGNNSVPCAGGTPNCGSNGFLTGYNTANGYDLASGLGSVDATAMVAEWGTVAFTATATTLGVGTTQGSYSGAAIGPIVHGTPLYFQVGVSPNNATGDVSVTNTSGVTNNAASFTDGATLTSGSATYSSNDLPGGTYTISAYYAGDTTHAASTSSPAINVTITPESSSTSLYYNVYDPHSGNSVSSTTVPYGYLTFVKAQPYGNNSTGTVNNPIPDGVPTGSVNLSINGSVQSVPLNSIGIADYITYTQSPGTYTYQASYPGDASFQASSSPTPNPTLTVTKANTTATVAPSSSSITASQSATITLTLNTDSYGNFPGGSFTLTGNGQSFSPTLTNQFASDGTDQVLATFTVPGASLASGANTLTVSYAGDTNYNGSSQTASVTLTGGSASGPSFNLTGPTASISISAPGQSGTGTVSLAGVNNFSGSVSLTCTVSAATSGVTPSCSLAPASVSLSGSTAVNSTLTVSTTANTAANSLPLRRFFEPAGEVALGCLLLLSVPARRRSWRSMVALLFVIMGVGAIGCGGSSSNNGGGNNGTPTGAYTVTVSGTSGSTTASTTVTVTVQ